MENTPQPCLPFFYPEQREKLILGNKNFMHILQKESIYFIREIRIYQSRKTICRKLGVVGEKSDLLVVMEMRHLYSNSGKSNI
jgi:hypothetical protein